MTPTAGDNGLHGVGNTLMVAREQKKLTVESVATELHLRPEVVRALESGDAAMLPADAFVRGYIKSYARLLGLDDTSLLAQLPRSEAQRSAPLKRVGMRTGSQARLLPIGKWLIWGATMFVAVMLVLYGVPMVERLLSGPAAVPDGGELALPRPGDVPGGLELPDPVARGVLNNADGVDTEADAEADAVEPPADEMNDLALPPAGEAGKSAGQDKPPAVEQDSASTETPAAQPAVGPALVELRFSEDSWVEMEARGRKLVVGTQPAGSRRSVRAEPPIQILLGNAPGVELSYRGKPVDLAPYQRGKVARVTLED